VPSQVRSLLDKRVGAAVTFRLLLLAEQRQTAQDPDFFHFTRVMARRRRCSVRSAVLGLNTSLSGNPIGHCRYCRHGWQSQGKRHWALSGSPDFRWRDWPTCAHSSTRSWRPARGFAHFQESWRLKSARRKHGIYSKRYGSWNCGPELLSRLTPLLRALLAEAARLEPRRTLPNDLGSVKASDDQDHGCAPRPHRSRRGRGYERRRQAVAAMLQRRGAE
jgi:hypothetical protein